MVSCFLTKSIENTIFQLESILNRLITHHEIFIGIVLMELHKLDTVIIFFTHNRISQAFSCISFSNSRSPLQDNIFLLCENGYETVIFCLCHVYLFQEFFFRILIFSLLSCRSWVFFANQVNDKFVFTFC